MKTPQSACAPSANYQAEDDARTLTRAQEVRSDAKRYKAACAQLKTQATATQKALVLEQKVKAGLKGVFGNPGHSEKEAY